MKRDSAFAKKLIFGLSVPVLLAGLGACGGGSSVPAATTTTVAATTTTTAAATTTTAGATTTTAVGATTTTTVAASGDSSGCYNDASYANGATYQQKLRSTVNGTVAQESTNDFLVTTGVSFKGIARTEVRTNTAVTSGAGAGSTNIARSYVGITATDTFNYGLINTTTVSGFSVDSTFVFTPTVTYPRTQSVNAVHTQTYKTTMSVPGTADSEITQTISRKFLGVERVTVAAGSFNACKFLDSTTAQDSSTTTSTTVWIYSGGTGAGTFLKALNTNNGQTTVTELVSATVAGGAALPAN